MKKLFRSLIGLLGISIAASAAEAAEAPRLVVGIHIDQLNAAYLDWFRDGFTTNGFKKLLQDGLVYNQLTYPFNQPDGASATASLATGSNPITHGIIARQWYDRNSKMNVSAVFDPNYLGNYTQQTVSPKKLLSSSITDELEWATQRQSKTFSIASSAEISVLSAGQLADGAFWMDETTGKWCTSTYYKDFPWWLEHVNDNRNIADKIDKSSWEPLYPLDRYRFMPHRQNPNRFQYWFHRIGGNKIKAFTQSPLVNAEIVSLGIEALHNERLGKDEIPDYLILNLTASQMASIDNPTASMEVQDVYFRLDLEIARILENIDREVGQEHCLVYLIGTGQAHEPAEDAKSMRLTGGDFYPDRCTSLLNLYLMALYGNDRWVEAWSNQQIYLDHKRIEEKGIDFNDIHQKAAGFLAEFSGVQRVIPYKTILTAPADELSEKHRNGFQTNRSGDFYLEIQPGWNIRNNPDGRDYQVRHTAHRSPLVFFGWQVAAERISRPIESGDLSGTLSRIFRIRPPNGSNGISLPEFSNMQ